MKNMCSLSHTTSQVEIKSTTTLMYVVLVLFRVKFCTVPKYRKLALISTLLGITFEIRLPHCLRTAKQLKSIWALSIFSSGQLKLGAQHFKRTFQLSLMALSKTKGALSVVIAILEAHAPHVNWGFLTLRKVRFVTVALLPGCLLQERENEIYIPVVSALQVT